MNFLLSAAVFATSILTSFAFAADDETVEGASALQAKAAEVGVVRVIVRLSPSAAPVGKPLVAENLAAAQSRVKSAMTDIGVGYVATIADLPLTVLEVDQRQLKHLISTGLVEAVQEDVIDQAYLADSVPLINAPAAWERGARGAGRTVAVLDTGVQAGHPFLGGRVVAEACFSTDSASQGATSLCPDGSTEQTGSGAAEPCDVNGCDHGTHVAGIAAGSGVGISGVAPEATIVAIQVFSRFDDRDGGPQTCRDSGSRSPCVLTYRSDQIRALSYVGELADQFTIASVNMSLGGGRNTSACDTDFRKGSIDALVERNIAVVIASGNEGFTNAVGAPGCISAAVTVGSTTETDTVSSFSNSASIVDLLAPGSGINSSVTAGNFGVKSGTSMATPHVAGAFAVLDSIATDATLAQQLAALETTGGVVTDSRNGLEKPRIDVAAALDALVPPEDDGPTIPPTVLGCTLCYSCGGNWPEFSGAIPTRAGAEPYERGEQCSEDLKPRSDTLPYLCCSAAP